MWCLLRPQILSEASAFPSCPALPTSCPQAGLRSFPADAARRGIPSQALGVLEWHTPLLGGHPYRNGTPTDKLTTAWTVKKQVRALLRTGSLEDADDPAVLMIFPHQTRIRE